ncbi:hypothetical protein [Flagellimonas nanhaiensis]|uniref:Uncharacterized protein n=1 Tax=Flagellimonas nanhaiensis TaxID=2292706 RepID=A0A371JPT5_9FLAO|nr:hypothetical protein [Allomuricauda nanhaiensis]RDY59528.1 hypothetical protein DX873_09115 [Allomuricauda nanhaiensis]
MPQKEKPISAKKESEQHKIPNPISLGLSFILGNPVNYTYLFIGKTLLEASPDGSSTLSKTKLVGQTVVVTGIVHRSKGLKIYVLRRSDNKDFYHGLPQIYADVPSAIVAQELSLL